tara:strand:- start:464 stop:1819 length:1356 start_codon:yes stop_codon:yes gene_type:complete
MVYNINKKIILFILSATLILGNSLSDAFIEVSKTANPAVVSIVGKQNMDNSMQMDPFFQYFPEFSDFFDLPEEFGMSLGSGVIIDNSNGYILTNNHVIDGADEISVILFNKKEFIATLVGSDELSDLALLKIEADDLDDIKMGDSDQLQVGEWVVAIGSPFQQALSNTVTAGIVSAIGRSDIMSNKNIENFIQHDAAINPGNSGGALLNLDGELVGINTAIATGNSWSPQNAGIGFAIPINQARRVIDDIIEHGKVSRGFLGVGIQDIDSTMAEALGMKNQDGALIIQVVEDSPADKAGLKERDVILKVEGKKVDNASKLKLLISSNYPGDKTKLLILSNKKEKTIYVVLDTYPNSEESITQKNNNNEEFDLIGLIVSDANNGVEIKKIDKTSNAYRSGLREGDIILAIESEKIKTKDDYMKSVDNYKKGDIIMMKISRSGRPTFIAFNIN